MSMYQTLSRRRLLQGLALLLALGPGARAADAPRHYRLATATLGGTYYPVGAALAQLISARLGPTRQIQATAINSAGSGENIQLLRDNAAQLALLTSLDGRRAWAGQGPFAAAGPQTRLRSITALWRKVEHFVVKKDHAKTGTIDDMQGLKGRPVSLGLQGAGALEANRLLLGNLGLDIEEDFQLVHLGFEDSARALIQGRIEAMSLPSGVPVPAVTLAFSALGPGLVLLEFTDAQLAAANGGLDLWTRHVIRAGTYPAQDSDVNTIATLDFLAARADVDAEAVYQITRAIYENLAFLRVVHKALAPMRLEAALPGLPVPLHPGAARFYREQGLAIPAALLAD
ncbi:MAG: TAXI family TRAP transporter solute-binding subunit [Pseudomonadota bacterium]|nr:TAXI family TRAP transporter solute-binding subunit [Pseudomonadota bacterium]